MFGVVLTELSLVVLSLNVKARPPRRISCPQLELQSIDCQAAIADCRAAILGLRLPGCDCRAAIAGPSWSREFPAHIGQENFLPTLVKGISCPHWSREHWSREFPAHTGQGNFLPTLVRRFPAHTGQGNFLPALLEGVSCPHWSREFPAHTRHLWTEKISTPPALAGPLSSSRCFILYPFASGHTVSNIPDPIRTRKLIGRRPGQYWGGGPPGKPFGCRWLFRFLL